MSKHSAILSAMTRSSTRTHIGVLLYWSLIRVTAKNNGNCSMVEARRIFHAKYPMKFKKEWADDRMVEVVKKHFPNQRFTKAALESLRAKPHGFNRLEEKMSVALMFGPNVNDEEKGDDICFHLMGWDRWDDLKNLVNDPIYGYHAKFEIDSKAMSEAFKKQENARQAQLHPRIKALQDIGNHCRWICSVHYPYNHPNCPFPDCLCVLGDGFPMFRLIVLDPDLNYFKVGEVLDKHHPWFDGIKRHVDLPDEADMDYNQLVAAFTKAIERINNR